MIINAIVRPNARLALQKAEEDTIYASVTEDQISLFDIGDQVFGRKYELNLIEVVKKTVLILVKIRSAIRFPSARLST